MKIIDNYFKKKVQIEKIKRDERIVMLEADNKMLQETVRSVKANCVILTDKLKQKEKMIESYQERLMALATPQNNYARYLDEKNVTDGERELKKMLDKRKVDDYKGMEELGALSTDMPVV